jgi:hypothetical protein
MLFIEEVEHFWMRPWSNGHKKVIKGFLSCFIPLSSGDTSWLPT